MRRDDYPRASRSFFAREAPVVARDLVGALLVYDDVVVRITEVEAYCGPTDSASHARHGRTARNAPLWGPPGHVYMYLCYGLHQMLNLVTADETGANGVGQAVLVRAGEVLEGMEVVCARRGRARATPDLLAGPGKLAQGLGLDLGFSDHDVCAPGGLEVRLVRRSDHAAAVITGPRVGIDYARATDRRAPLRFALAGSRAVTVARALRLGRRPA
ncbi:MAG: DNA-3-methyladenine glycosylase [Deltaproteobacteria bacterium]|nr:DNA-3-methyladenine glycosylase [Deltaproteobacteria bacterium]